MLQNNKFKELRIVDNFYQTSSYFPMPLVLISTLSESGKTNLGPYSLCFPYYVAGKNYYSMLLEVRNSSNTAKNILRTGKCSINFIPDNKKFMKNAVTLGFPGDTTEEKMKLSIFTLTDGLSKEKDPESDFPQIVEESYQVFECTWMRELDGAGKDKVEDSYKPPYHDFNGITSEYGAHFILRIDHILMKPKYHKNIIDGVKGRLFPNIPVDYGYRDNTKFWISFFRRPFAEKIPKRQGVDPNTVWYAANRIDPQVQFTLEACAKMVKVPRVFMNTALKGCIDWAKENNVKLITEKEMDIIRNKRSSDKKK